MTQAREYMKLIINGQNPYEIWLTWLGYGMVFVHSGKKTKACWLQNQLHWNFFSPISTDNDYKWMRAWTMIFTVQARYIDLRYFLHANRFSVWQCVISWFGESSSRPLVPTNIGGLSILPVRLGAITKKKNLTELERMFQVRRLTSHFLVPLSWSRNEQEFGLLVSRKWLMWKTCLGWGVADVTRTTKLIYERKKLKLSGGVSSFMPQNWCQTVVDFTRFQHFHASSHSICSPLPKHTLVASLNFQTISDPRGNLITVLPVPVPLPIGWEVWDMLIKPELIKCSLGLWVSLLLTSPTAVSVQHLRVW